MSVEGRRREATSAGGRQGHTEGLVAAALDRGDLAGAAEAVVRGYGPEILRHLTYAFDDEDEAAEVFSQVCEELWCSIGTYQGRSSMRTWIYVIVSRCCSRFRADPYRRRTRALHSDEARRIACQVRSSTRPYMKTEVKEDVRRLRRLLLPDERRLLHLRIDQRLAWKEIARIVAGEGQPMGEADLARRAATLRMQFSRIKKKIARLAREAGIGAEEPSPRAPQ